MCSIHPQGWVPIETTRLQPALALPLQAVAFTPKGGCPLKHMHILPSREMEPYRYVAFTPKGGCLLKLLVVSQQVCVPAADYVAFTPKGGCPLKQECQPSNVPELTVCSIYPQGWVPIETQLWEVNVHKTPPL